MRFTAVWCFLAILLLSSFYFRVQRPQRYCALLRRCAVFICRCVKSQVSGREFAVKKLADLETTSSARRVYNELCALSQLQHENVRHVFCCSLRYLNSTELFSLQWHCHIIDNNYKLCIDTLALDGRVVIFGIQRGQNWTGCPLTQAILRPPTMVYYISHHITPVTSRVVDILCTKFATHLRTFALSTYINGSPFSISPRSRM